MSHAAEEHRKGAPKSVRCAVLTISDSRTLETDTSGATIFELLVQAGHEVVHRTLLPDDPEQLQPQLRRWADDPQVQAILVTGGTGISPRDRTFETVLPLLTKTLPGFGELFRVLSYEQIGAAAMLSRAIGGLIDTTVLLVMPGSRAAVQLAMERLVLPELGHLVREATKGLG